MGRGTENMNKNTEKNIFYKTNPRGGISLIVLVITIIVVIILAAAVIISLQNNNPMVEANKARINSDVANMQAIFTNAIGKIMAENEDLVQIEKVQLNTVTSGDKKTVGVAKYKIVGTNESDKIEGEIRFDTGAKSGTTYYTGRQLPLYSKETKWYVDSQGLVSVNIGGTKYGEGEQVEEEGEEIAQSDNPMLQFWGSTEAYKTDFHSDEYKGKITKVKFATNVKVPSNKIESWDVSKDKDGSVMAWVQSDGEEGYILTIVGKEKIIANPESYGLFEGFSKLKEIENINILDTSKVTSMNSMFSGCTELTSLDLRGFDTSKVINMNHLFAYCRKLENVDLSSFNTSNVTEMYNMFYWCNALKNVNLSNFDTSKLTNTSGMFCRCYNVETEINITSNNITTYDLMFNYTSTVSTAKVIVNYTAENSSLVDTLIATKLNSSNVVKGRQI